MSDYTRVAVGNDSSGRPIVLNQRTADLLAEVERLLGRRLTIVQGSYRGSAGASASAGTNDKGGVLDLRTWNLTVAKRNFAILAARQVGFPNLYRTKAQGFDPRTHWVAIGDHELPASAKSRSTSTA